MGALGPAVVPGCPLCSGAALLGPRGSCCSPSSAEVAGAGGVPWVLVSCFEACVLCSGCFGALCGNANTGRPLAAGAQWHPGRVALVLLPFQSPPGVTAQKEQSSPWDLPASPWPRPAPGCLWAWPRAAHHAVPPPLRPTDPHALLRRPQQPAGSASQPALFLGKKPRCCTSPSWHQCPRRGVVGHRNPTARSQPTAAPDRVAPSPSVHSWLRPAGCCRGLADSGSVWGQLA